MQVIDRDPTQLMMYQIQMENYRPFVDRVKHSIDVWGSNANCEGGEYAVRAKQIAAYCQTAGLNDPNATPEQRLAMATCLWKGKQTYDLHLGDPHGKNQWKEDWKKELEKTSVFFGLGSKTMLKKMKQQQRTAK